MILRFYFSHDPFKFHIIRTKMQTARTDDGVQQTQTKYAGEELHRNGSSKKRKLDDDSQSLKMVYFKLRTIVRDLRPHFIEARTSLILFSLSSSTSSSISFFRIYKYHRVNLFCKLIVLIFIVYNGNFVANSFCYEINLLH